MTPARDTFVQRLGRERLQVISELGEGATGTVYRVRDRATGGMFALKVLRSASPRAVLRFQREATLTASLRHPNVVSVHNTGVFEGRCFIAYELIEGARGLGVAFHGEALRRRIELLRDAARGLGHAHAHGIVHRDVKPDNVLVGEDGRARVTDFGLALTEDAERLTRTGAMVGTPYYMAPEQADGHLGSPVPATDVWALGVILYEALTDERPFDGESLMELVAQIAAAAPTPPSRIRPVPRSLEDLCLKALQSNAAARPPDGEAFARALEDWLAHGGSTRVPRRTLLAGLTGLTVVSALALAVCVSPAPPQPGDPNAHPVPPGTARIVESPDAPQGTDPSRSAGRPDWTHTLGVAATFRVRGRRRGGASSYDDLELTLALAPPTVERHEVEATATIAHLRFRVASLLDLDYDSSSPAAQARLALDPDLQALVRSILAARLRIRLDLRSGEVLSVHGLPVGEVGARSFLGLDGRQHVLHYEMQELADWFTDEGGRGLLNNALHVLPPTGSSFTARTWYSPTGWLVARRRVVFSPDLGGFRGAVDGTAQLFVFEAGKRQETAVSNVRLDTTAELQGDRIVRTTSALAFEDRRGDEPIERTAEFTFELLDHPR